MKNNKCDHGKSQEVRKLDVLIIGPALIYLSCLDRKLQKPERLTLLAIGAGTIVYNWLNWQRIDQGEQE